MTALLDYFQKRQEEFLRLIQILVDIESPSRDAAGSRAVADFLETEAQKLKCVDSFERIEAKDLGEHLVIRAFQNHETKPVLLLGHTDTVHPRGTKLQNPTRIENDKFFGCGVFDMKANCILMLEILRAFDELDLKPSRGVTILLSCDEEIGSFTGRKIVEREAQSSEFCLVCEPSANGRVKTGRKGTGLFTLKAHGAPAHAGLEPEKGASAILELARQIPLIQQLNDYANGTSASVCTIIGGTATNVIPATAECTIDVRFKNIAEAARVESAIRSLRSFDEKISLEIVGEINRPPMERNENTLKLYEKARTIAASFGYELGETEVGGASDGNFVAALGVPVLDGLGIAGDGAHMLTEHILISDIVPRSALAASMLL